MKLGQTSVAKTFIQMILLRKKFQMMLIERDLNFGQESFLNSVLDKAWDELMNEVFTGAYCCRKYAFCHNSILQNFLAD